MIQADVRSNHSFCCWSEMGFLGIWVTLLWHYSLSKHLLKGKNSVLYFKLYCHAFLMVLCKANYCPFLSLILSCLHVIPGNCQSFYALKIFHPNILCLNSFEFRVLWVFLSFSVFETIIFASYMCFMPRWFLPTILCALGIWWYRRG